MPDLVEAVALELVVGVEVLELAEEVVVPVQAAASPAVGSARAAAEIARCPGRVGAARCLHSVDRQHGHRFRPVEAGPAFRSGAEIARTSPRAT